MSAVRPPNDTHERISSLLDSNNQASNPVDLAVTLYHGTSAASASRLQTDGWSPDAASAGANMGQSRYLYLTSEPEDALWFAEQKGENTILELRNVSCDMLKFDPEDGDYDEEKYQIVENAMTVIRSGQLSMPIKFVLTKACSAATFSLHLGNQPSSPAAKRRT